MHGNKHAEIHCGMLQKYTPYKELVPELGKNTPAKTCISTSQNKSGYLS